MEGNPFPSLQQWGVRRNVLHGVGYTSPQFSGKLSSDGDTAVAHLGAAPGTVKVRAVSGSMKFSMEFDTDDAAEAAFGHR